jgi:mRNA interferase HigB
VHIIALRALKEFWVEHPEAEMPLRTWFAIVDKADWSTPADIKEQFGSADFVADNRVIFNIGGNKFRLIVWVAYKAHRVLIKFVGTHAEYDKIDPVTCEIK